VTADLATVLSRDTIICFDIISRQISVASAAQ